MMKRLFLASFILCLIGIVVFTFFLYLLNRKTYSDEPDVFYSKDFYQWYLDDSIDNSIYVYMNSWRFDPLESVDGIDINYSKAMSVYREQKEVCLAIIDSGADVMLYDSKDGNIWHNDKEIPNDGIDNDNNGYVDDLYGWDFIENDNSLFGYNSHGELMTNILVNQCTNDYCYIPLLEGTAVKIMILRATDDLNDFTPVISAVQYAEQMGADICCMPNGSYLYSEKLFQTVSESSMLFFFAAGNDGVELNKDFSFYPAMIDLDNTITVTSLRSDGKIGYCANFGKEYVDMAAPGTDIATQLNGKVCYIDGTSGASVISSACCAIYYSTDKEKISAEELKKDFLKSLPSEEQICECVRDGKILDLYELIH